MPRIESTKLETQHEQPSRVELYGYRGITETLIIDLSHSKYFKDYYLNISPPVTP